MTFEEAMTELKSGKKVTRKLYKNELFLESNSYTIKAYRPILEPYIYDSDIMLSEDWLIDDLTGRFQFYEIVLYLQQGFKARIDGWKNKYIYLDHSSRQLIAHYFDEFVFMPSFIDFVADDWMVIE